MRIRDASYRDIPGIIELLKQVGQVHHEIRPDIFRAGAQKYDESDVGKMIYDPTRPIFVAVEGSFVRGYCFCIFEEHKGASVLTDIKTLYIDDLCVDENLRGRHLGTELYEAAARLARDSGCYNLTLNVWSCNPSAMRFYEAMGLLPQKVCMELVL